MKHPSLAKLGHSGSSVAWPYALPARPSSSFLPAPGAPQPLPCLQRLPPRPPPCTLSAFRNGGIASDPCSTFRCPTGKPSGGGGPALCLAPIPYLQPPPSHPTLLEPIPTPPLQLLPCLLPPCSALLPLACQPYARHIGPFWSQETFSQFLSGYSRSLTSSKKDGQAGPVRGTGLEESRQQ